MPRMFFSFSLFGFAAPPALDQLSLHFWPTLLILALKYFCTSRFNMTRRLLGMCKETLFSALLFVHFIYIYIFFHCECMCFEHTFLNDALFFWMDQVKFGSITCVIKYFGSFHIAFSYH